MVKILSYPLSAIYYLVFFIILLFFHPVQWLCLNLGGSFSHQRSVVALNFCLMQALKILLVRVRFHNPYTLPINRSLIIVSNHQSMQDIPALTYHLRKHNPRFIAKKELASGIPSVSFNLRHGGNLAINRGDPLTSGRAIRDFAKFINHYNYSVVIFPEGTRSRTGRLQKFQAQGIRLLLAGIEEALIVPVAINNSWKIDQYGVFPLGIAFTISLEVLEPIQGNTFPGQQLVEFVEKQIGKQIFAGV